MGIKISDMPNLTGSKSNDDSFLLITDLSGSTSDLQNRKLKVSTFNQIFSNNKSVGSLSSYNNFFGSEQDGDVSFLTSTNITSENNGEIVVKQYKSCSISLGATVTTSNPCRGLVIFCTGDLTVDGTLTMTGKGGGVGNNRSEFNYNITDASLSFNTSSNGGSGVQSWNFSPSGSVWQPKYRQNVPIRIPVLAAPSGPGTAGVFSCGSGGAGRNCIYDCAPGPYGGVNPFTTAGNGGIGSLFAGGGGGGAAGNGYCAAGNPGNSALNEIGGAGGDGSANLGPTPTRGAGSGGGGAGYAAGAGGIIYNGGAPGRGASGTTGAGGLLIIIVRGNVSITGTISSNGSNGGAGGLPTGWTQGCGGGGSGGGRIIIVYGGTYSNAGTVQANGGAGGIPTTICPSSPCTFSGYDGGAGVITVQKVDQ